MDKDTSVKLYNKVLEPLLKIEEIFNKWFGEDKVDLQYMPYDAFCAHLSKTLSVNDNNIEETAKDLREKLGTCTLYVYFGTVDVTNENNDSERIYGLIASITLRYTGKMIGNLLLNRHLYTRKHLMYGYLHSHVSGIPSIASQFQSCCLGTGPIRRTIATLNTDPDDSIWELFCVELQRYVETESLRGGPYHRLAALEKSLETQLAREVYIGNPEFDPMSEDFINTLTRYIMSNADFTYAYADDVYMPAMSAGEFAKYVTRAYFNFRKAGYDDRPLGFLMNHGIIVEGIIENNTLKSKSILNRNNHSQLIGNTVCIFKGKPLTVEIIQEESEPNTPKYYVVAPKICSRIWSTIVLFINTYASFSLINKDLAFRLFYEREGDSHTVAETINRTPNFV